MMAAAFLVGSREKPMTAKNRTSKHSGPARPLADVSPSVPESWMHGDHSFDFAQANLRKIRKDKDILVVGQHYETLFVNHDGWLCRYKILNHGARQILDFILPGQIFGMQACLFNTSLYSVSTITEASISAIPFDMIDSVFERSPWLAKALFWSAACESAILGEHLIDTARRSAYERVSHLLLELFVRLRAVGLTEEMSFHMPLTQELIGDALGLSAIHVNRTFRKLREAGLVKVKGHHFMVHNRDALARLADFESAYLTRTPVPGLPFATCQTP